MRIPIHYIMRIVTLLLLAILMSACRGQPSEEQQIYTQYNMYWQDRFDSQQENPFFADRRGDREPVEGTVSRGNLRIDNVFYEGLDDEGNYVTEIPVDVDRAFVKRGQEQYEIFCQTCHGGLGDGQGIIREYGLIAPSFHTDFSRGMPEGEFFEVITDGIRTMGAYGHKIAPEDRWAIVSYIRALQRSQYATEEDLQELDLQPE